MRLERALALRGDAGRGSPRAVPGAAARAHIIGVVVSETTSEIRIAIDKRDGEFAEQPADDAAHQQDREEHRDQREAHRQHGEADFARAEQRRLRSAACRLRCGA